MKCEISMCVQHLQAHLTTPVLLQTHPLTEPMALCGTTKCPQHGKLLEYYCLDDWTCVCVSCAIEDQHRLHNMKTFATAHKELTDKLRAEQEALRAKTDGENGNLEKWEKSESEKLRRSSVRLVEAVTNLRDLTLGSVHSSVSARTVSIKTSQQSMKAALTEKDTFRFLQMYAKVHQDVEKAKGVDLRRELEPGGDRDKLVEEIKQNGKEMVQQADKFWGSLFSLVDRDQESFSTGSDVTLEPQISDPGISLSKDNRKVYYSTWSGQCSATLLIRGPESVPHVQRWMVGLSRGCDWTVGLCDKQSGGKLKDRPVYGLCWKDGQLSSLTTELNDASDAPAGVFSSEKFGIYKTQMMNRHHVSSALVTKEGEAAPRPEMVEVFWNLLASSLSFFSRAGKHQREELVTIKMSPNNRDLVPFVQLGTEDARFRSSAQNQWTCSCGWVHKRPNHLTNCSCGQIVRGCPIAEVLCELL